MVAGVLQHVRQVTPSLIEAPPPGRVQQSHQAVPLLVPPGHHRAVARASHRADREVIGEQIAIGGYRVDRLRVARHWATAAQVPSRVAGGGDPDVGLSVTAHRRSFVLSRQSYCRTGSLPAKPTQLADGTWPRRLSCGSRAHEPSHREAWISAGRTPGCEVRQGRSVSSGAADTGMP